MNFMHMSSEKKNIDVDKIVRYWVETSDDDGKTMTNLFNSKDYHWALFIGHLVLEKLLKASVVKKTCNNPPFTHDLTKLAKLTGIAFSEVQLDWLDTITTFNLNARYDSYKKSFYLKCTFDFTKEWLDNIITLQKWIKEQLSK
jgi:HEPN domain-containing protein